MFAVDSNRPSKHLLVFKTSWRHLQDMSYRCLQGVLKTNKCLLGRLLSTKVALICSLLKFAVTSSIKFRLFPSISRNFCWKISTIIGFNVTRCYWKNVKYGDRVINSSFIALDHSLFIQHALSTSDLFVCTIFSVLISPLLLPLFSIRYLLTLNSN